ncbi:MAG: S-adenosyl-l-methionine hydroxide adenosyltransferase family protein [Candidatus Odinarchaeota archaeon]
MSSTVAIVSDFGQSEYLGIMKGVILAENSSVTLIDLYNHVEPQNVKQAAWILEKSFKWFPTGTVFLCVVDPGVGTSRKAVALETTTNHLMVGPDNGLFWLLEEKQWIKSCVELPVPACASATFHGRDIFAPVAASLSKGTGIADLGKKTTLTTPLTFTLDSETGSCELVHIDHFGNLITNLSVPEQPAKEYLVHYIDQQANRKNLAGLFPFSPTYNLESGQNQDIILIKGSYETFEIAAPDHSAKEQLDLFIGTILEVKPA